MPARAHKYYEEYEEPAVRAPRPKRPPRPHVVLNQKWRSRLTWSILLVAALAMAVTVRAGLTANMDYAGRSMKAQMKQANKHHARYALILGEDEVANGIVQLKDMEKSEQQSIKMEDVVAAIQS